MVSTTVNGLQGCNAMWLILDYTGAYYAPTVNLTYWETNCRFSSRRDLYISMTLATRYDAQETKRPIFFYFFSVEVVTRYPICQSCVTLVFKMWPCHEDTVKPLSVITKLHQIHKIPSLHPLFIISMHTCIAKK